MASSTTSTSSSPPRTGPRREALSTIYLRSPSGEMVQLSNVVTVEETVAPKELRRFNQLRAVTISANL